MSTTTATQPDIQRPVSFEQAARILRTYYPRYAFDRYKLRRMALARVIPCMRRARGGTRRAYAYTVRVADLLQTFERQELNALDY